VQASRGFESLPIRHISLILFRNLRLLPHSSTLLSTLSLKLPRHHGVPPPTEPRFPMEPEKPRCPPCGAASCPQAAVRHSRSNSPHLQFACPRGQKWDPFPGKLTCAYRLFTSTPVFECVSRVCSRKLLYLGDDLGTSACTRLPERPLCRL
jgi:hypothetical protein